ncbi:MAG TPA: hypothetical protein VED84_08315 [Acidimicrobiales bacterium]|nr:hypothetical protein [Acidimicrobiales bacterium]
MNPDTSGSISPDVSNRLVEIDGVVAGIAVDAASGSQIEALAYAIHNLIGCMRDLHGSSIMTVL